MKSSALKGGSFDENAFAQSRGYPLLQLNWLAEVSNGQQQGTNVTPCCRIFLTVHMSIVVLGLLDCHILVGELPLVELIISYW